MAELPSAEAFVGSDVTESGFKAAQTQLIDFLGDLDGRVSAIGAGHYGVDTYATADTIKTSLPAGTIIEVGNDPDPNKNGSYNWDGVTLKKSQYDPKTQAINISKEYVDVRALIRTSFMKLFSLEDGNNIPIVNIYKNGSVWIKGLKKDIATYINSLNQSVELLNSLLSITSGSNIIEIRDFNNVPVFSINKSLDVKIGKYQLSTLTESLNILKGLVLSDKGSNFLVLKDTNNIPLVKLNKYQDLIIPKVGNITEEVLKSKKLTSKLSQGISSATGAEYADNVLEQLTNSQSSTTLTAITAAQVNDSGIFPHPVTMLRIPAITRIAVNKYLCFFEARRDGDDFGENSQGVVTLTVDQDNLTVSATNLQSLHSTYVDENNKRWTFMNACAVKLDSGRIIVLYVKRNGTTSHALYKRYSDDDGVTWSEYEDIGHFLNMPFYNLLCPCSQGLVKRFGSNRGRIIFPVWYSGVRYRTEEFRAGYIYSDDDGETWHDGSFNNETMSNEVQCAEDVNGDILFCIRREVTGITTKTWSKLLDGDFKLTPFTPHNQLCETPIMSGLIQAQNKFDKSNAKFQYVGTYSIGRKNLKLFTSFNGGSDWTHEYDVANTNITSVYSCIERLSPTQCFVLWEADYVTSLKCQILSINETNTGKQAQEL